MAMADSSQLDRASYDVLNAAGSGSSLSSPSSSSSSSSDGHSGFFKSRSRQESPSTAPLCFGGGGVRGSRARAPAKHQQQEEAAATMAPEVKGDVVGRHLLRKISKALKKARSDDGERAPSSSVAAVDDTARDRAESVARTVSYCKDTLRRGAARSRPRRAAVWPLGMQTTMVKRFKEESPCPASPSRDGGSLAATAVAHGEESPRHGGRSSLC